MKKLLILMVVVGAALAGTAYYIKKNADASPGEPKIEKIEKGNITVRVSGAGKTVPKDLWYVGLDLPYAKVTSVTPIAKPGEFVKKDTTLAYLELTTLDTQQAELKKEEARAAIKSAEAAQNQAEAAHKQAKLGVDTAATAAAKAKEEYDIALDRYQKDPTSATAEQVYKLRKDYWEVAKEKQTLAQAGMETAEAGLKTAEGMKIKAEAGLKTALAALNPIPVKAPIDGYILEKKIIPGQPVSAQSTPALFAMVPDLEAMEVVVPVAESDVVKIKQRIDKVKTMTVTIHFDAYPDPDEVFEGHVASISNVPATLPARTGIPAELAAAAGPIQTLYNITVDNIRPKGASSNGKPLKAGFTANVEFVVSEVHDVLRVPTRALNYTPAKLTAEESTRLKEKQDTKESPLWLWESGERRLIFVRRGESDGQWTEIEAKDPNEKLTPGVTEIIVEPPPKKEPGFVVRTT